MTAVLPGIRQSRSLDTLSGVADELPPVSLAEVNSAAGLQTRSEHKYLLAPEQFSAVVQQLGSSLSVLQIEDRRLFDYESVYFDTSDLELFRAHRQGRRRRYKVRTRTYLDSQETMIEVKLKGRRGETIKHRRPHAMGERDTLTRGALQFVAEVLGSEYGVTPPELSQALTTNYSRATLVDLTDNARLTCDVELVCSEGHMHRTGPDLVLVESKSSNGDAMVDRVLASMGLRPLSLSKYCLGTAMLNPHLPANRWNRLLRRAFGWEREHSSA